MIPRYSTPKKSLKELVKAGLLKKNPGGLLFDTQDYEEIIETKNLFVAIKHSRYIKKNWKKIIRAELKHHKG